jgi:hypothetical protein
MHPDRTRKSKVSRGTFLLPGAIALILVLLFAPGIGAVTIENVTFEDTHVAGQTTLVLHGAGVLRRFVWKGYVAALYLEDGATPETVLSDTPKRLELEYFRSIKGPDFGEAADKVLAKNFPEEVIAPLRKRLDRINRFYRDVKPGDRYALTYLPRRGTELSYNGTPLVLIEGADFASAYFAIWLGRNPIDEPLKKQLLRKDS